MARNGSRAERRDPLYVRYRDVQPIWEVGLQMLFYASPVIYVIDRVPDSVEKIFAVGLWVFTREAPRIAENL